MGWMDSQWDDIPARFTHYNASLWLIIRYYFVWLLTILCFFSSNKSWASLFALHSPLLFFLETFNFCLVVFPHGLGFHISAFSEHLNLLSKAFIIVTRNLCSSGCFQLCFCNTNFCEVISSFCPSGFGFGRYSIPPDELLDYAVVIFFFFSSEFNNMLVSYFMPLELYSRCLVVVHFLFNGFLIKKCRLLRQTKGEM